MLLPDTDETLTAKCAYMASISEALSIAFQQHESGQLKAAAQIYRQVLTIDPSNADALHLLGLIALQSGDHDSAVEYITRAIHLNSDNFVFHTNLGNSFMSQGKPVEAVNCFRRALRLSPDSAPVLYNLATGLTALGNLEKAVPYFFRALELKPDYAEAHNNLGAVLQSQRKLNEAIDCYRRALEINPDYFDARANLLLTLPYRAETTLMDLAEAHAEAEKSHATPLRATWQTHENNRDPNRVIRLGFVSADFSHHPVGYFLIRALENLDRSEFETVCYCDRPLNDDITNRFRGVSTAWREVHTASVQQLAEQIRNDRIDILFDLAGYTAKERLLAFAYKPAPIQVTWAGYVGTTGLKAMDYILADRYEIPPGVERYYCERVLRMPDGYVSFDPPDYAPPVSPLPASTRGFITFGSFNKPAKITDQIAEAWSRILRQVPQSRLVIKNRGMDEPSVAAPLMAEFANHGVDPGRIDCVGWSPHPELLAEYRRIDLALDTYPYNGGLTTCEALWMGVPVITCPGETFASRHSLSHLSNIGLTETIARDFDDYVERAASFATDVPRLAALREGLRPRMAASPLLDGKRFANNFTSILRDAWQQWCQEPAH